MDELQTRKNALLAQLAEADEPPPLLHASMADLYRDVGCCSTNEKVARNGRPLVPIQLVAGACNQLNLDFSWSAALRLSASGDRNRSERNQ